jgi:Concanavalin A-like lectin/glucanases superfamily
MRVHGIIAIAGVFAFLGLAADLSAQVVLDPTTTPSAATAGSTVSVKGTGFPAGTIANTSVTVTITPPPGNGAPVTTQSIGVATIPGAKLISFTVPSSIVANAPIVCAVRVSGSTSPGNTAYTTATPSSITVNPPAKVTNISPGAGTRGTAVTVTIAGSYTNFQSSSTITVGAPGGITVSNIQVQSTKHLTATFTMDAAATPGVRDITVKSGTEQATMVGGFLVGASPGLSFTSIAPNSGQQGQTLSVTVTGDVHTQFDGTTFANFGDGIHVNPPLVISTDQTSATANISIDSLTYTGWRTVTLVTGGQFSVSGPQGFQVTPSAASLVSVTPNSASQSTNLHVTLKGSATHFLQDATTLSFGAGINVGNVKVNTIDPTVLDADLSVGPAATVGAHDVTVTTGGEIATLTGGFTVLGSTPFLSSVTPTSAAQGANNVVVNITGVNTTFLTGPLSVDFGSNITVNSISASDATHVAANISVSPIANTGGRTAILHSGGTDFPFSFSIIASGAAIISVIPGSGPQGGSPSLTVTGVNTHWVQGTTTASIACCSPLATLTINRITINPANPTVAVLDITIPANAPIAAYSLTMATGGEVVSSVFSVYGATPTLAISPGTGKIGTTVPVNLTGQFTHFDATTTLVVSGQGVTYTNFKVTSAGSATAKFVIAPDALPGSRTVTMTTGTEVVTTSFGVTSTPAVLTSISPYHSASPATLDVTITGQNTNFVQGTTTVGFGPNVTVTSPVTVQSLTSLVAHITIDAAAAYGWRTCFVNTGAEQLQIAFRIDSPATPVITSVASPNSGFQGQTVTGVVVSGQNTNWQQGVTQLILGAGVTVNNLVVNNATTMTADIAISPTAPVGGNTLVAITGTEIATGTGFTVLKGASQILSVTPNLVTQNQTVIVTIVGQGSHWLQGGTTADFGPNINVDVLTIQPTPPGPNMQTATAQITVLSQAAVGLRPVTLTTDGEVTSINQGLDVEQGTPTLLSSIPNSGLQGETKNIQVLGRFTHWQPGVTTASYTSGIFVNSVTVQDSITALLNITVDPLAFPDTTQFCRNLTMTTGTEQVSLQYQFCIGAGPAQVTNVQPNSGVQGQALTVTVTGNNTHWVNGVTTANFGAGVNASNVHVTGLTSATVDLAVSAGAATGLHSATLTTQGEVASMANAFTVTPGTPTLNGVAPVSAQQGETKTVHIIGQFTHWQQGVTTATFGQGITVNNLTIGADQQSADASLTVDPLAYTGGRTVTMTTNTEIVSGNFFSVTPGPAIISSVAPTAGNQGQEKVITITGLGTHWVQGLTQFSMYGAGVDITVNGFLVNSPTSAIADITISPNAVLGARSIYISTAGEVLSDPSVFVITGGVPSITFLSPGSGTQGDNNLNVTINGILTNWTSGTTLVPDFGPGVTVTSYTVNSFTSITAVVNIDPAAPLGFNTVVVRTGPQVLTGTFQITSVSAPPTPFIYYLSPSVGLPGQTFTTSITGKFTHWDLTTQATFGAGIHVNNFQVTTPTTARANITIDPAAAAGVRSVILTTGAEVDTASFSVVIATPTISIIDPGSALQGETGKDINVIGQYTTWDNTTTFSFGAGVTINNVTVLGPTIARVNIAVAQLAALGNRSVSATTGAHIDTGCCFAVTPSLANISSLTPNTDLQNGTPTVSVVGQFTHWQQGITTFSFGGGGINVTGTTIVDATHATLTLAIAALAPLGAHSVSASTAGEVASLNNAFIVQPGTPLILSSAPSSIQQQAGLNATILGQFTSWVQGVTTVSFGANSGITVGTVTVTPDGSAITAGIQAAATAFTGYRTLYVTTGSQVLTLANALLVTSGPAAISLLNPTHAPQGATLDVAVTGTNSNFVNGVTTASFGPGIAVNSVTVTGLMAATVNITIADTATVGVNSVSLTTLGETASAASAFTIDLGTPTIVLVSPANVQQGATKDVAVTSVLTHFAQGATSANFGTGVTINTVTVTDAKHATVNLTVQPTTNTGARNVTMTTNLVGGGQEIVVKNSGFSVITGPAVISSATPTNPPTVHQGDTADVIAITGSSTNFSSGVSTVAFCTGVTANLVQVNSATSITATVSVSPTTTVAPCGVTVTTAGEVATGANLFSILAGIPALTQLSQTSAHQGDSNISLVVTGAFTHFTQGVTTANFGSGITVNNVTVTNSTSASVNISVLSGAALGSRDVTMTSGGEVVTLSGGFSVLAPAPSVVSGHVTNPDASPSSGATVVLTPSSGSPLTTATDPTGFYSFTGVPLGAFSILATQSAQGLAGTGSGLVSVAGQQLTVDIHFTTCAPSPSGLIHWWPGDGSASDVVGTSNGTLSGGATFAAGKVGQGFSFNNAGLVAIPHNADMNLTTLTMEGWIFMNTIPTAGSGDFAIATKGLTTTAENYGLYVRTVSPNVAELLFEWWTGSTHLNVHSTNSGLTAGVFHHVAVTTDGSTIRFYVDGQAVGQAVQSTPLVTNTVQLQIGSALPNYTNTFNGVIDELSLYNRVLTPLEIQTVFAAGSSGKCKTCIASPPGLVSWWTGDSDTNDLLGNNNSVASNAVTFVPGVVGSGFKFGTGGYIDINPSASLANQQLTLSAWARPDGAGPNNDQFGNCIIEQDFDNTHTIGLYWRATDSHFLFTFGSDSTEVIVSTHAFPTGQFYQVAGTYDGATFKLYVNGQLEGQMALVKVIAYTSNKWTIGAESPNIRALNFPRTWNGVIDEVQAFNRALSQAEIQAIYTAGGAGQCRPAGGACLAQPSGTAAWWPEDGNALDLLANSSPAGTNAISFVPGKVGLGVTFGTGGYIDIPENPALMNQRFTLSAWVRPDGPGPNNDQYGSVVIEQDIDGSNGTAVWWRATDNHFLYGFGNIGTDLIVSAHAFPPGQFYLVQATYDGATFKLYVNGALEASQAKVKTMVYSTTPWTIGSTNSQFRSSFPRTWIGVIDEVLVFNRALTDAEIQAMYAAGTAGVCKPASLPLMKPVSYAMQNGQSGTYHYWDDTYSGSGSHTTDGAALSGGVGQLTDGFIGGAPFYQDMGRGIAFEWVGWNTIQPTIVFDFGVAQTFHTISIHSYNQSCACGSDSDVPLWNSVTLDFSNDGVNFSNAIVYTPSAADRANLNARFIPITIPSTAGRYVRASFTHGSYMMISEVQFQ